MNPQHGTSTSQISAIDVFLEGQVWLEGKPLFPTVKLALPAGEWTCLLGGSGVGKSTLLRILADLEIGGRFEGHITTSNGQSPAHQLAYMAQMDLLLPWANVLQNITLGARLRGQKIVQAALDALLDRVYLRDHMHKKPDALSGGQRQRVALARTLMENKPLILLDEPFSALDARTRADMQELASELLADKTVLLVTHDPSEAARLGHHIHILSKQGLQNHPAPTTPSPRALEEISVFECQNALLQQLRKAAS